jgi:hypothetical protein
MSVIIDAISQGVDGTTILLAVMWLRLEKSVLPRLRRLEGWVLNGEEQKRQKAS